MADSMSWFRALSIKRPNFVAWSLHLALVATIFGGFVSMATQAKSSPKPDKSFMASYVTPVTTAQSTTPVTSISPQSLPLAGTSLSGSTDDPFALARSMNARRFGDQYWPDLYNLWVRESGWNPSSRNTASGACGIPQALPCSKINDHSTMGQINWGLDYIGGRYGNPHRAWQHWLAYHWY
ncbi:MAG TPA: hypothetical protein VLF41_00230 [Candidatus Nanoarchaeia archaeon]|nr:hypothetical protein [Candidatus Nanoarchaeia archaeon]